MRWRPWLPLALAAAQRATPRPSRLRVYDVRTCLHFDHEELKRVNARYDRSGGIKADVSRAVGPPRGQMLEITGSGA